MGLFNRHNLVHPDNLVLTINSIKGGIAPPYMESVYIDVLIETESLFIATASGVGIFFERRQGIVNDSSGLYRQFIDGFHRLLFDNDPELHNFISDNGTKSSSCIE
jgi:hypothetical protein